MHRALYTLLLHLLIPAALAHLAWRARRQPDYLAHVGERFGRFSLPAQPVTLWVHAVSVGETRAAKPLIDAWLARHPDHRLLLTHTTPTGRETSEQLFGDRVQRAYLPYDLPWAIERFLAHYRPRAGVLMETELWPNLTAACHRRGVPLMLANARLSERSAHRYRRWRTLAGACLRSLTAVLAQTPDDAARLRQLGAGGVQVTGNLKFDLAPDPAQIARGQALRADCADRPVWLAASTRDGEETLVLEAYAALPAPRPLLVVVPRHPQRFDEVAALLAAHGLRVCRRSRSETPQADTDVWLGDSMGELPMWYALADVALVGGSLLPLGGQNLIEACAVGCPVVVGPHTFNFAQATADAVVAGAAVQLTPGEALGARIAALLADPATLRAMGAAGRAFAAHHRGATERTVAALESLLPDPPGAAARIP